MIRMRISIMLPLPFNSSYLFTIYMHTRNVFHKHAMFINDRALQLGVEKLLTNQLCQENCLRHYSVLRDLASAYYESVNHLFMN